MSTNNPKRTGKNKHMVLNQNFHALGAANVAQSSGTAAGMPRLPTTGAKRPEPFQHSTMASPKRSKLNSPIHAPQATSPSLVNAGQRFLNAPMSSSGMPGMQMLSTEFPAKQSWEEAALIIPPEQLKEAVQRADSQPSGDNEIERMLCGAAKQLRDQRNKPDSVLVFTLLYLAKIRPLFFCSNRIIEAFGSLLKAPNQNRLKSNVVPILVINIFYSAFHDEPTWPDSFLKYYTEDALGERVWVDNEECKDFVEVLISCFQTKLPPKSALQVSDILSFTKGSDSLMATISGATASEDSVGGTDEASSSSIPSMFSDKESVIVPNITSRYTGRQQFVIEYITKVVSEHLARLRPQGLPVPNADISKNLIRLLLVTAGVPNIRLLVAGKLENWMQNPKLSKLSQDLLLTLLLNVTPMEMETLSTLMRIKLKGKPLLNSFVNCIKEALKHNEPIFESIFTVVTRNEMANIRPNGSNTPLICQLFAYNNQRATFVLSTVLLNLILDNQPDEVIKSSHVFLRELARNLKAESNLNTSFFVHKLLTDSRAVIFNNIARINEMGNSRERILTCIVDLVVQALIHSISPLSRDSSTTRADRVRKFHLQTAEIVCMTVKWIEEMVLSKYTTDTETFYYCIRRILFQSGVEQSLKSDNISEAEKNYIFGTIRDVPVKDETLLSILQMGMAKDVPLKPNDACDLCFELIHRAASINDGDINAPVILFSSNAATNLELIENFDRLVGLLFESTVFFHNEGIVLPPGFKKPKISYKEPYFKVWLIMVMIASNFPDFGRYAYQFSTFRMLVEMIITNSFQYPPFKVSGGGDNGDEQLLNEDYRLSQVEKVTTLEFENKLADTVTINETNSYLVQQTITCDPRSIPRRAVVAFLAIDKYRAIVSQTRLCALLCQCRDPDYLLKIIEQQQAKLNNNNNNAQPAYGQHQMSWLNELVESKENNFSVLPVDCLAEYLLNQFADELMCSKDYHEMSKIEKGHKREHRRKLISLISHFIAPNQEKKLSLVQLVLYLTKRLSSPKSISRRLAYKILYTMVTINPEDYICIDPASGKLKPLGVEKEESGWFFNRLSPYLESVHLETVCVELVNALFYETSPFLLTEYLEFIAKAYLFKTDKKLMKNCCCLVLQRKKIFDQILIEQPDKDLKARFLTSLFRIFTFYMEQHIKGLVFDRTELPTCCFLNLTSINRIVPTTMDFVHSVILLLANFKLIEQQDHHKMLYSLFLSSGNYPQLARDLEQTMREPLMTEPVAKRLICSNSPEIIDLVLFSIVHQETLIMFLQYYGLSSVAVSKILQILDKSRAKFAIANQPKLLDLLRVYWSQGISHGYKFAKHYLNYKEERADDQVMKEDDDTEILWEDNSGEGRPQRSTNIKKVDIQRWFKKDADRAQLAYIASVMVAEMIDDKQKTKKLTKQFVTEFINNLEEQSVNIVERYFDSVFNLLITLIVKDKRQTTWNADFQAIRKALQFNEPLHNSSFYKIIERFFNKETGGRKAKTPSPKDKKKSKNKEIVEAKVESSSATDLKELWTQIAEDLSIERAYQRNMELVEVEGDNGQVAGKAKHLKTTIFTRNRSYFLSLLLHKSNFATLNNCIKFVLEDFDRQGDHHHQPAELNATAVLNFLSICLNSPKLWIDRDVDATQKIVRRQDILQLSSQQMAKLIRLVAKEGDIEHRVDLVIRVCCVSNWKTKFIAKLIQDSAQRDPTHRAHYFELYTRIYLQIPSIEYKFYFNATDQHLALIRKEPSYIDKVTNNLITSLMNVDQGGLNSAAALSNPLFRSWELSLTKIASSHPLLFIRQLPIIPAILSGKMSLVNYETFKAMGMLNLYKKLLPILHLLMPYLWYRDMPGVTDVLNLYMDLFICYYNVSTRQQQYQQMPLPPEQMSNRELVPLLMQFLKLISNWIEHDTEKANIWIGEHRQDFSELAQAYPSEANTIRAVQSGISSLPSSNLNPFGINTSNVAAMRVTLLAKIRDCTEREERRAQLELMDELNKLIDSQPELVESLLGMLQSFYLNTITCEGALRLTVKLMQKNPKLAPAIIPSYLKCLNPGQPSLCSQALGYLHEIVILAQDFRYILMQMAFKLAIGGNAQALSALHLSFKSLNTQLGC